MGILGQLLDRRRESGLKKRLGPEWGAFYYQNGLWPSEGTTCNGDGSLHIPAYGITVPAKSGGGKELVRAEYLLSALCKRANVEFEVQQDRVVASIDGLKIGLRKSSDFATLAEVFEEDTYRFHEEGDFLFMDIGANIGLAALYFASRYKAPVFAFELVPSTAAIARENFALNPQFASQIQLFEYGLADKDQAMTISVNRDVTAGNSIYQQQGQTQENVQIKDAAQALRSIAEQKNGRKLVVKLDAEGAEYCIMRRWNEDSLMSHIDLLMIEWHDGCGESVDTIREVLTQNHFGWFERKHHQAPVGYVYAYKK